MKKKQEPKRKRQQKRAREGSGRAPRENDLPFKILYALAKGSLLITAYAVGLTAQSHYSRPTKRWGYEVIDDAERFNAADFRKMLDDATARRRLSTAVWRIRKRRDVRLRKKNGVFILEITEEGKRRLARFELNQMRIEPQYPWDGVWRIVLFDVPEKERVGRDMLRQKLRDLGFFQLQKSAFVLPYPCRDEIDYVVQRYDIAPYVTIFEAPELGYHEAKALAHFHLKPYTQSLSRRTKNPKRA